MGPSWPLIKDLLLLRERLNRLLDEVQLGDGMAVGEPSSGPFCPAADLFETDGEVVVILEIPGVDAESIELKLQGDTLRVAGRIQPSGPDGPGRYLRLERAHGAFYRDFKLPLGLLRGTPTAQLERGVLTVRLAKRAPPGRRRVEVIREGS
jgi:HSP20 family protein